VPLLGRLVLAVGVLALAVAVLYVGVAGFGTVAAAVGSTVSGFVDNVTRTPPPSPTPVVVAETPSIVAPSEPYTNREQVDLIVTVASRFVGDPAYRIRVYLALEDQEPAPIDEASLSLTPQTIIPVMLTSGINDFSVTLIGPAGESESSPIVRYVLDQSEPSIKLDSPKDGATVNRKAVDIEGRTQGRSTVIIRNRDTGESIGGKAEANGAFSLTIPLAQGSNRIAISATDPAGNSKELELVVRRGSGELSASLSADTYRIARSALPTQIRLTATVDDPDGRPLSGAKVTFTLSIPGIKTVTGEVTTRSDGKATFGTTIPRGADIGGGSAAILVRSSEFGSASDQTVITITK